MKSWNASLERDVLHGVRRVCEAPSDSATLRRQVARQLSRLIPSEAFFFNTLDPDTGLLTHVLGEGAPLALKQRFMTVLYPGGEAERVIDLARVEGITSRSSPEFASAMQAVGFRHEMRAAFTVGEEPWGLFCALRERGPEFGEREVDAVRRVMPWVARGLRTAVLVAAAAQLDASAADGSGTAEAGVVVVDQRNRVLHRTAAATAHLSDVDGTVVDGGELPLTVTGLLARQRRGRGDAVELRIAGHSGRWYSMRATLTEPDAEGRTHSVIVTAPLSGRDIAPLLARIWGLTAREREVTALAARGYATKEIAARMQISPYTVQDHFDRASEKVGVRGRRELLAKLFLQGFGRDISATAGTPR
jgi:DNA-binding CsgD family transcriptional regulator